MKHILLNGIWTMHCENPERNLTDLEGTIPGSVYSFLMDAGLMEDPYYRDNELQALDLIKDDYTFSRTFDVTEEFLSCQNQILRFDGIDTLAEIILNNKKLGNADNFHRYWEFDVSGLLKETNNLLSVKIKSPTKFIAQKDKEDHFGGAKECMKGFPYLRKPHCMFGWDWGPRLPDEGIWKDVKLLGWNSSRLEDIYIEQKHKLKGGNEVSLTVFVKQSGHVPVSIALKTPNDQTFFLREGESFSVPEPELWWPNGLGSQPLYEVTVTLNDTGTEPESITRRIGLRTLTMRIEKDQWGETFATEVNGQTFFAMGADYVPEDNIFSRRSAKRTHKLIQDCADANFNAIRVWGGGYYPDDWFYDACDEFGLVVWQDMMFACANYKLEDHFVENIQEEMRQNIRRLRHHASLGLWCGNNEMEQFALELEFDGNDITRANYIIQNEYITPQILKEEDPDTLYWPSSPSSGGKYVDPRDPNRGDVHYWDVWHGGVPFTEYRKFYFRYLSEFGFQSFPCMETIKSFTLPEERNVFSRIMEMHQRNAGANGKILQYLSQTYLYPTSFEKLIYASQLLQADAIRYGVEHFRRNRNDDRCMGAIYWQLNDIWPVASWASIDYYGRWKALHYAAKRFFAPVMISCEEVNEVSVREAVSAEPSANISTAKLCVTNETWNTASGTVEWELRDPYSNIICNGSEDIAVDGFSSLWLETLDFSDTAFLENHLTYRFVQNGKTISEGSVLFCAPKHYAFADPSLELQVSEDNKNVTVISSAYAKSVEIYSDDGYVHFDDNFFDMEKGSRTLQILEGNGLNLKARSVFDIK